MKVKILGGSAIEIFDSIRQLTNDGQLQPGDNLPSVRELAQQLGVNRNTVSAAYQRLTKAGIAITQGRLGTRICQRNNAGEQEGKTETSLFDLADGSPKREWLPDLNQVAEKTHFNQFLYGEAPILSRIIEYGNAWFSPTCPANFSITLCNGAIDSLERLMAAHLVPGDTVIVEDPCYISSANAIRLAGLQVMGANVDEQGLCPKALKTALEKGAKAVLITPRAHNPTGANLTKERALQLKAVLRDYPNVLVMEDDHFALLAISEHHSVIPETTRHWAVFRSVSKGLGPDLRMAFVAADSETIQRINTRLAPGMSWVSRVLQSLVFTCLTEKIFQQHLEKSKKSCELLRINAIKALKQHNIQVNTVTDGLNIWIPVGGDCKAAAYELSRKGWLVRPGTSFDIKRTSQAIRVSIQNLDEESANKFADDLASVLTKN